MLPPTDSSQLVNIGDPKVGLAQMRDCIRAVHARGDLHFALLNLVSTFIDGLSGGPPSNTKKAYLDYLAQNFPELCASLGAEVFFSNYRCKAVHEFGLKEGFAIGRDSGLHGAYVDTQLVTDLNRQNTVLNIDRLVQGFLTHLEGLIARA